jgi:hypothetical protein
MRARAFRLRPSQLIRLFHHQPGFNKTAPAKMEDGWIAGVADINTAALPLTQDATEYSVRHMREVNKLSQAKRID